MVTEEESTTQQTLMEEEMTPTIECEQVVNKYRCYYKLALTDKNTTLCEKSGIYQEACINEIKFIEAIDNEDINLCNEISQGFSLSPKSELYNLNDTYTEYLRGDLALSCKYKISILKKDLNLCINSLPERCKATCYLRFATILKDLSLCDEMVKVDREYTQKILEQIKTSGHGQAAVSLGCEFDAATDLATCKFIYARKYHDISLCSEIKDHGYPDCELTVARESKNPNLCEEISSKDSREKCYYHIAVDLKDESLCYNAGEYKVQCYESIIENK